MDLERLGALPPLLGRKADLLGRVVRQIGARRPGDQDRRPSDADLVAVAEHRLDDPATVDLGAVEAVQIADSNAVGAGEDLGVDARHGGLVELDVGVRAAADDQLLAGP